jgi:4-amino-4-deoxy-L-arabinose transferase-like glycosyltransferase
MKHRIQTYSWLLIPLVFLLYSAPGALDFVFHFPDEKYYTDAVLQMMDKEDYLTPYSADGTPRFLKPIVTYWVLIGSYTIFGVSPFSSRFFFWIAGALVTVVTYFMGNSILRDRKAAMAAALITASNPLVLMGASRSIPDILLVMFLTISAWGFLKIMTEENPQNKYYWMAYLGAALAFQTKGLPAAAFAGLSILYLLLNPWQRKHWKQVVHPAPILASAVIAISWFAAMYIKHGTEYLSSFFADQVGYRVSSKSAQVFGNSALGIINLAAFALPWILIAFSMPKNLKKFVQNTGSKNKAILGFIILWIITVIAMSGAVFKFYDRYLLPVIPVVALAFALIIAKTETRFKISTAKVFIILNIIVVTVNILFWVFILTDGFLVAGSILGIFSLGLIYLLHRRKYRPELLISGGILLLWFNMHTLLFTLLMPNPGEQLVQSIQEVEDAGNKKVYVYGNIRTASNIRIHSGNRLDVVSMDTIYSLPSGANHILVFSRKEEPLLNLKNYQIKEGSEEWKRLPEEKFPVFMQESVRKVKESGTEYFIAIPQRP